VRLTATATFTPSAELGSFIASKVQPAVRQAMERACLVVQDSAKRMCPVDTGRLRDSIDVQISEDALAITGIIAPHTEYAGFVEFGTSKMRAQPYMRPAIDGSQGDVKDIFVNALEAGIA
jgi:HK97 gp10 family phage protein